MYVDKYKMLNTFFNGKLDEADIKVLEGIDCTTDEISPTPTWAPMSTMVGVPANTNMLVLWQWNPDNPISSLNLASTVTNRRLRDLIPRGYMAKRMVVIGYNEEGLHGALFYILNGIVTVDDPVHKVIEEQRQQR